MSLTSLSAGALADAKPTTVRWRIFAIVFVMVVFNLIDRTALSIAMPTIAQEFGLSPAMQGIVLSSFFWTYALLQVPGGWLIDRYGPRRLVAGATHPLGHIPVARGVATGGVSLLLTRLGLGVAEAPLFPAGAKLNAIWLSPQERGRGAVFMDSGSPLGAAFGGAIIAFLILLFGSWRLAFLAAGLATIAVGLLAWRYLRDDPAAHPGVNAAELAHIAARGRGRRAGGRRAPSHRAALDRRAPRRPHELGDDQLRPADLGPELSGPGARLRPEADGLRHLRDLPGRDGRVAVRGLRGRPAVRPRLDARP